MFDKINKTYLKYTVYDHLDVILFYDDENNYALVGNGTIIYERTYR